MNTTLKEEMLEEEFKIDNSTKKDDNKLKLKFNLNIIELLGSQLYTRLPSIISEFVSNSYDADATKVEVTIDEDSRISPKRTNIIIKDNGTGIASTASNYIKEINNNFLNIGRKRRKEENNSRSKIFNRKLQGKKGIGKLAGFGITNEMKITTTTNKITNSFILNYEDMINTEGDTYFPKVIQDNEQTNFDDGTIIELLNIRRKKDIVLKDLSENIAKRLQVFDDNFSLELIHIFNGLKIDSILLTNDNYLEYIKEKSKIQFCWNIPEDLNKLNLEPETIEYFEKYDINGKIFTTDTPLKKDDQGIVLYANKKLCQENYCFNDRANDNFYNYLIGKLNIDYIDEDINTDNISTARDSLVWENEISQELKTMIDKVIKKIQIEWRGRRKEEKEEEVNKCLDMNIDSWLSSLAPHERETAKKIVNVIINDESMESEKAAGFIKYVQEMYSFNSFKDFATGLINKPVSNLEDILTFIKDWELIEAKEMAKISEGRIEAIKNFEKMILHNESETKVIQPFLEKFPWILDPTVDSFKRELTFSKILKETFPDDKLNESDRRIDFMCFSSNNEIHIWELKRPKIKIDEKYHNQIYRYQEFAMEKYPNYKIITTLVSDNWSFDRGVELMFEDAIKGGKFKIKSYTEMLKEAKNYHDDFINKYNELYKKKEELV